MQIKSFGITDVGRQRQHNEDAYLVDDGMNLYLVADGMGGHAAGEVASQIAAEAVSEFISHTVEDDGTWPHAYDENVSRNANRLASALRIANTRVIEAMKKDPRLRGMGTTVVAGLFDGNQAAIAHVGDSRAYVIRGDQMSRITSDHSWVFEQVRAGMLTEAEAEKHPLRNVITRALGGGNNVIPDVSEITVESGDYFLFCSDGLTGMVSEDDILRIVTSSSDLEEATRELIGRANEHGGQDNITAVLLQAS